MNRLVKSLLLVVALAGPVAAEDPVLLGLRGALNALTPVPEATARSARTAVADLLAPYLTKQGANHLCQRKTVPAGQWLELQGLKIQRVTAQAVSQADRANGIQEKLLVFVDCVMYRTRKAGEAVWSPWVNGKPILFPPGINVEHGANGAWTAASFYLQYLNPIGNQRPQTNPQAAANPATAGLPPGMSRAGSATIPPPAQSIPPTPQPAAPILTPIHPPGPKVQPAENPSTAVHIPAYQSLIPAGKPTIQNQESPPPDKATKPFDNIMPLIVVAVVGASAISLFFKKKKRHTRSINPFQTYPQTPPPVPRPSAGPMPPPLPAFAPKSEWNPINLMERRDNLMSPAELAFFAVLEPIVRSSYMISSKVRLADLFDVRQERGQQAAFNKISRKHIDFVLTDYQTSRILCGIELDDSSHNYPDRIERDRFVDELFAEKQLPLLRVPFSWTYHPAVLREALSKAGVIML